MLSKLVVNIYSALLEIGLWLILLIGGMAGWQAKGVVGAIGGVISAAIFGAVFFGAFLVLNDIRDRLKAIESTRKPLTDENSAQEFKLNKVAQATEKDTIIKGRGKQCRLCGEIYAESYMRCPNCN